MRFYYDNMLNNGIKTVLTSQKSNGVEIASVSMDDKPAEDSLTKEWLLTNSRGSYASSTIIGCNTRRYHGLLIGSLTPPTNKIMALVNCVEMVICNSSSASGDDSQNTHSSRVFNLSTFEFSDKFAPEGYRYIGQFRRDIGVHFDYELDNIELTKSIYLLKDTDTVVLVYEFTNIQEQLEFSLRPLIGLRDFHVLQKSYAPLRSFSFDNDILVCQDIPDSCELFLRCPDMSFEKDEQWWFNFIYRNDRERGQEFNEDLWTPGFFKCHVDSPTDIVFWANLQPPASQKPFQLKNATTKETLCPHQGPDQLQTKQDIDVILEDLRRHQSIVIAAAKIKDEKLRTLCLAADQFITKRQIEQNRGNLSSKDTENKNISPYRTTILAGFPWFADWGRDTFIALPGLLLATGRFENAKSVLTTFADAADEGMIPNRFDDYSETAHFNSIDASLWFINAAFQYLNATEDLETFTQKLLPIIRWIIESYQNGTRFDIHADADGLIMAGNEQTQLTWMDTKCDGVAFTPRHGKAVEINALWYNSLCLLREFYNHRQDLDNAKYYHTLAEKVAVSFTKTFWNQQCCYLNDCILPDGSVDSSLRPNQIFAVSLAFSPLSANQKKTVVDVVQKELLTPYGLRTLNTQDSRYKGIYQGPQKQRDEAYHQGTIWPFLIGPFVEAYLKVNGFSRKSKRKATEFIEPLMRHFTSDGCLGQLCEIFDADAPHKPKGCIAQAWSVAELIRAHRLING